MSRAKRLRLTPVPFRIPECLAESNSTKEIVPLHCDADGKPHWISYLFIIRALEQVLQALRRGTNRKVTGRHDVWPAQHKD
jgi:hypothetical protein